MNHKNARWQYQPDTLERRALLSRAHLRRLGIPEGFRRVYGTPLPSEVASIVWAMVAEVARTDGRAAAKTLAATLTNESPDSADMLSESFFEQRQNTRSREREARRVAKGWLESPAYRRIPKWHPAYPHPLVMPHRGLRPPSTRSPRRSAEERKAARLEQSVERDAHIKAAAMALLSEGASMEEVAAYLETSVLRIKKLTVAKRATRANQNTRKRFESD